MSLLCKLGLHRCHGNVIRTKCSRCGAEWVRQAMPITGKLGRWERLDDDGLTHDQAMQIDREISDRKDFNRELRDDYFGPRTGG